MYAVYKSNIHRRNKYEKCYLWLYLQTDKRIIQFGISDQYQYILSGNKLCSNEEHDIYH